MKDEENQKENQENNKDLNNTLPRPFIIDLIFDAIKQNENSINKKNA